MKRGDERREGEIVTPKKQKNLNGRIIAAAYQWFRTKRPQSYTLEQHLANPAINTATDTEANIAIAVANMMRAELGK